MQKEELVSKATWLFLFDLYNFCTKERSMDEITLEFSTGENGDDLKQLVKKIAKNNILSSVADKNYKLNQRGVTIMCGIEKRIDRLGISEPRKENLRNFRGEAISKLSEDFKKFKHRAANTLT